MAKRREYIANYIKTYSPANGVDENKTNKEKSTLRPMSQKDSFPSKGIYWKSTGSIQDKPAISQNSANLKPKSPLPSGRRLHPQESLHIGLKSNNLDDLNTDKYNMNHLFRGRVAIFSHEVFEEGNHGIRKGTEKDVERLKKELPRLGFRPNDISVHRNFTLAEINETLNNLSGENYENRDCLMVFVLTHGDDHDRIYAKDTDYAVDRIWRPFLGDRCAGLAAKPKIFFIVACRGANTDAGVQVKSRVRRPSTTTDAALITAKQTYTIPSHADILTVYSTLPGHYSFREPDRGTWYIEALCREIGLIPSNTDINFIEFLTAVNRKLALSYFTFCPEEKSLHQKKQCSSFTSTLLRTIQMKIK